MDRQIFVSCTFSSDLFSGFTVKIDISNVKSLEEVVEICRTHLLNVLKKHNFEVLITHAETKKFHIHQPQTLESAKNNPSNIIWICDHEDSL
jgi:hypothetical protein